MDMNKFVHNEMTLCVSQEFVSILFCSHTLGMKIFDLEVSDLHESTCFAEGNLNRDMFCLHESNLYEISN